MRGPHHQIRWESNLASQDSWIHSDEIDKAVKFRFWHETDLKATLQRGRFHRGRTGPRKQSEKRSEIQRERDRVMQSIMRNSVVQFEEYVSAQ